ncbi:P-loop containing nucleoside triphosphate hydrolase protein [Meira miltonrushii]|uniref:P-loop containing nucleoside triphosphate hydrolase protein n=1 Tax=Meira miltonrushii TaxID=1280837 RepID=A0A316V1U1_9BASI|nr:P-loop containing nucleoside triphosphate hydrolase protein [Meira miltonrushii]PWN31519.1 P-loop containing nucleoside triphosphate hydrolase protein [Meira miltonrushii]
MGPSGAGKSTLLDLISGRVKATSGTISWSSKNVEHGRTIASYVEQHDSLLGVLTVRETLYFSAKLSMPHDTPDEEVKERTKMVLKGLGLSEVANNRIGTPIKRGISGGQKRRVTIGCSLVSMPKVLFLDEPTSGLDIHTAFEVMSSISSFAKRYDIAVCATIHSPNWDIFQLFNKVMLLAKAKTIYFGNVYGVVDYMEEIGLPCPERANPADHLLRIVADDSFSRKTKSDSTANKEPAPLCVAQLSEIWQQKKQDMESLDSMEKGTITSESQDMTSPITTRTYHLSRLLFDTRVLTIRNIFNYQRNLLAYGVRFAMYVGMGVLMATIWVNLAKTDSRINDRLSIHFFSVAFLGFMSVAGIPSFLEDRAVMKRERFNGLYGPASFTIASTLVIMPFLFICALAFALISYWSIGLHPGARYFFRWLAFLYIGVLAAEMQSLLVAAILPIFVAALAIAAFINGFWMTTQGYFIRTVNLPRFWYYWAHFINYETYAFALLVRTDFNNLQFKCIIPGQCAFPPSATNPDIVNGDEVIKSLDLDETPFYAQIIILLAIVVIYRILFYMVLKLQKP